MGRWQVRRAYVPGARPSVPFDTARLFLPTVYMAGLPCFCWHTRKDVAVWTGAKAIGCPIWLFSCGSWGWSVDGEAEAPSRGSRGRHPLWGTPPLEGLLAPQSRCLPSFPSLQTGLPASPTAASLQQSLVPSVRNVCRGETQPPQEGKDMTFHKLCVSLLLPPCQYSLHSGLQMLAPPQGETLLGCLWQELP